MATNLVCPECCKSLKTATPVSPGKKVKCPQCETVFTVPPTDKPASPIRSKDRPFPSAATRRQPDDEGEDRASSSRRDRDRDVAGRRSPRGTRRDDDWDDDDDDADGDFERRKPSKSKTKQRGSGLLIGLIAGGAGLVLVLFLLTALVWPGFLRSSAAPSGQAAVPSPTASTPQPGVVAAANPAADPQANPGAQPGGKLPAAFPAAPNPKANPGEIPGQNPAVEPRGQDPGGAAPGKAAVGQNPLPAGKLPDKLTYQFKNGETYLYAVTIVASPASSTETNSGHVELTVKSSDANAIRIAPSVNLAKKSVSKTLGFPRSLGPPRIGPPTLAARQLTIDRFGKTLAVSGDTGLPYLLGDATDFAIEPLSPQGDRRWGRATNLNIVEGKQAFTKFGPKTATNTTAREVVTCEIVGSTGSVVRINKKFELKTSAQAGQGAPRFQLEGQGEIAFDAALGAIKSCEYKATLTLSEDNITLRVPMTISYRLLDAAQTAAHKKEREERIAKAIAKAKQAATARNISDAEIGKVIEDVKSGDEATFRTAADRLARSLPLEGRREEVAAALEPFLQDRDSNRRQWAARALKVWGTAKNVPALVKALTDPDGSTCVLAIETLGILKDSRGAEGVAQFLPKFAFRGHASMSLKAMGGAVAEKAVLPMLQNKDLGARVEACRILAEIGGKDALAALQAVRGDSNRQVAIEAERAIKTLQARAGR